MVILSKSKDEYFLFEELIADTILDDGFDGECSKVFGKLCDRDGNPINEDWVEVPVRADWQKIRSL